MFRFPRSIQRGEKNLIFKGRYSHTNWDSPLALFVETLVRVADNSWIWINFLIDLGADGTYLPFEFIEKLGIQLEEAKTEDNVSGVGGQRVEHVPFITQLRFESNGNRRTFDLEIGIFTREESLDLPVLGRDVMNFFTLLCDAEANLVWLVDEAERGKILQLCNDIDSP